MDALITMFRNVIIFAAFAMPTAGLASIFADNFDGDTKSAVALTLGTTILPVISIPVFCGLISLFLAVSAIA